MNYNTQNKKIASITEKTLIVGIDVGSTTHYARAFDWRNQCELVQDIFRDLIIAKTGIVVMDGNSLP